MKTKKIIYALLFLLILTACDNKDEVEKIPTEAFPDLLFEKYLLQNFDSDEDGQISISEAIAVKDINCSDMRIASIKGIQYFTELVNLNCSKNEIKDFDISKNTSIRVLDCSGSPISALSVDSFTKLQELYCSSCLLKELDLRKNKELHSLQCSGNPDLQYIYVTHNIPHKNIGNAILIYSEE